MKPTLNKYHFGILFLFSFSLIVILTDIRYLFYCDNFNFDNGDDESPSIPVIYIHYNTKAFLPQYLKDAIDISVSYKNDVTLITHPFNLISPIGFKTFNLWELTNYVDLFRFKHLYYSLFTTPTDYSSDRMWEYNNMERFFILKKFMQIQNYSRIFYVDSDSVLLTRVRESIFPKNCNSFLSYEDDKNSFNLLYWVVWAGMGMIDYHTISEFTVFSSNVLKNVSYWPLLVLKDRESPFVCDMTFWYLFAGIYDQKLQGQWNWPVWTNSSLPTTTRQGKICNIQRLGFDHGHKHKTCLPMYSYHFQGREKSAISYFKSYLMKKR